MKGTPNKTSTHAFGSTLSYGRRYLKMLIFDVATTDDDGRAASSGERISLDQRSALENLLEQGGGDKAKFCRYYKVDNIGELPTAKFAEAFDVLTQRITARAK